MRSEEPTEDRNLVKAQEEYDQVMNEAASLAENGNVEGYDALVPKLRELKTRLEKLREPDRD